MSFDLLAPHYDWLEALTAGQRLDRARRTWLPQLGDRRRLLSVGEGHGRFAAAWAQTHPHIPLTAVEGSAGMLARARRRFARLHLDAANVTWLHRRWPEWRPALAEFDGIATCFFLDCFPPETLAAVIGSLARGATDNATWLNVDFSVPARGFDRLRARAVHALMYGFFRVATRLPARRLTPPDALFAAHGFQLEGRREWNRGLIRADLWRRGPSLGFAG